MSDLFALAVMGSIALSCGLTVAAFDTFILPALKAFYRALAEQLHRQRADSDRAIVGDVPRLPDDFPVFHSATDTPEGQQYAA